SRSAIQMQVKNEGTTNLVLRLIFEDALAAQNLTTVTPVNLAAGSGWTTVTLSLASSNLTGGNYNTALHGVTNLDLVHSPAVISSRSSSPAIKAQVGVGDITALPPPIALGDLDEDHHVHASDI